jgi:putative spermidine/putrescine transport system permease protein
MKAPGRAWGGTLLTAYLILFYLYLESPILIIFMTSLNNALTVTFPPAGLSLRWYAVLWDYIREASGLKPGLVTSLWTSVWLGGSVMSGAVVAGVLAAYGLRRYRFPGRDLLRQCFLLPILFPQVVTGVGLVLWFSAVGGVPTWLRLLLGHMLLTLPYVVVTTGASLETLDERLEEAAMNLGANRLQTFWHITLPAIRSGIVSGAIFAWLISFSNFTVTYFLFSGEMKPLTMWIFEVIERYVDPSLAALSTLLILLTFTVLLILNRLFALGRLVGLRR